MAAWVWTVGLLVSMINGGQGATTIAPTGEGLPGGNSLGLFEMFGMTDPGTAKSSLPADGSIGLVTTGESGAGPMDMATLNDLFSNTGPSGGSTNPLDQLVNNLFISQGSSGSTAVPIANAVETTTAAPMTGGMDGSLPFGSVSGMPGSESEILAPGVTTFDLTNLLTGGAGMINSSSMGTPGTDTGPGTGTGITNPIDNAIGTGPSPGGPTGPTDPTGPTGPGGSPGFGDVLSNQQPQGSQQGGSQQGGSSSFGNPGSPNRGLPSLRFQRRRPRPNLALTMMFMNAMSGGEMMEGGMEKMMLPLIVMGGRRRNAVRGSSGNFEPSSFRRGRFLNSFLGGGRGGGGAGGAGAGGAGGALDFLQNVLSGGSGGPSSGMMSGGGSAGGGAGGGGGGGGGGLDALFGSGSSSGGLGGADLLGPAPSGATGLGALSAGTGSSSAAPTTDLVSLLLGDLGTGSPSGGGTGTSPTGGLSGGMVDPVSMLMGGTGTPGSTGTGGGIEALFNSLSGPGMISGGGGSSSFGSTGGGFAGFLG